MVVAGEKGDRQDDGENHEQRRPGGLPWHFRVAPAQSLHRKPEQDREQRGAKQAQADTRRHVSRELGFIPEVRPAIRQAGKIAHQLAVDLHLLLRIEPRRKRR